MNAKILLADDEKDILDLLENVLRKDGFQSIQRAETGMGALKACREFQPDVVILDIMLPDIDGLEVCRKIREFSYCSILFLSSRMMISIKSSVFPTAAMIILPSLQPPGGRIPRQGAATEAAVPENVAGRKCRPAESWLSYPGSGKRTGL